MKRKKRVISGLLVLVMLLSLLPLTAFAAVGEDEGQDLVQLDEAAETAEKSPEGSKDAASDSAVPKDKRDEPPTDPEKKDETPTSTEPEKKDETPTPTEPEKKDETPTPTEPEKKDENPTPTEPEKKDENPTPSDREKDEEPEQKNEELKTALSVTAQLLAGEEALLTVTVSGGSFPAATALHLKTLEDTEAAAAQAALEKTLGVKIVQTLFVKLVNGEEQDVELSQEGKLTVKVSGTALEGREPPVFAVWKDGGAKVMDASRQEDKSWQFENENLAVLLIAEKTDEKLTPDDDKENAEDRETVIQEEKNTSTQTGSLDGVTVEAEIPEDALNEYAKLTLAAADEEAAEKAILALVNAAVDPTGEPEAVDDPAEAEESAEPGKTADKEEIEEREDLGETEAAKPLEIVSWVLVDIGFRAGDTAQYPGQALTITVRAESIKTMAAPRLFHLISGRAEELTEGVTVDREAGEVTFVTAAFSPFAVADLAEQGTQAKERRRTPAVLPLAAEPLPSGTGSVNWHLEENGDGYTLVVEPGSTTSTPEDFLNSIQEALGTYAEQITELQVMEGIVSLSKSSFAANTTIRKAKLPQSLQCIYGAYYSSETNGAFYGCTALEEVVFATGEDGSKCKLYYIDRKAFAQCSSLRTINLMDTSLSSLRGYAFEGTALEEVTLPPTCTNEAVEYYAFQNCASLRKIDLSHTTITRVPSYFAYNCPELTEVLLPDTIKEIQNAAFTMDPKLETLTLPRDMTKLTPSAISNSGIRTLVCDAKNLTAPSNMATALQSITTFIVTENAQELSNDILDILTNKDATVLFRGPNELKIRNDTNQTARDERVLGNLSGDFYVDEQGVLYKRGGKEAYVVYVPPGLETLAIPETIPGPDGSPSPVTLINSFAMTRAADLTAVTIASPDQITLAPASFRGQDPHIPVNGETEIDPAKFKAVAGDCGHALVGEENPRRQDSVSSTVGDPNNADDQWVHAVVGISNTDHLKDGVYTFWTGESARLVFDISNNMQEMVDSVVRLYLQVEGDGFIKNDFNDTDVPTTMYNGGAYVGVLTPRATDVPGLVYFEISDMVPGGTVGADVSLRFPNISTDGGRVRIWVETVPLKDLDTTPLQLVPTGGYMDAAWITQREEFHVEKQAQGTPTLRAEVSADDAEGTKTYVSNLIYKIREVRDPETERKETEGADYLMDYEIVDVVTLPEGFRLDPELQAAIEAKGDEPWTFYSNTWSGSTRYNVEVSTMVNGEKRLLLTFDQVDNVDLFQKHFRVSVDEGGNLVLHFKKTQSSFSTNANGEVYGGTRNNTFSYQMTFGDKVILLENQDLLFDEEGNRKTSLAPIRNTVSENHRYSWTPDAGSEAYADSNPIRIPESKLSMAKSVSGGSMFGDTHSFTIQLQNEGVYRDNSLKNGSIRDSLNATYYMSAEDLYRLFTDPTWGQYASVDIKNCKLCVPVYDTVTDVNGNTHTIAIGMTSGDVTDYHGMEPYNKDDSWPKHSNGYNRYSRAQIAWNEGKTALVLTAIDSSTEQTITREFQPSELQSALDAIGFYVTYNVTYDVIWNLPEDWTIDAGKVQTFPFTATSKESFMRIQSDTKFRYGTASMTSKNTAYAYKADDQRLAASETVDCPVTAREVELVKSGLINGEIPDEERRIRPGDIVDYTVQYSRTGTGVFNHLMPLTDNVQGGQVVLVPVTGNESVAALAGLEQYTAADGAAYYILTKPGEYHGVTLGGYLTDKITVTRNAQAEDEVLAGTDTVIRWIFPAGETGKSVTYKVMVDPVRSGLGTNAGSYAVRNETWLGDHETHRLYNTVFWDGSIYEFEKWILEDDGSLLKESNISNGDKINYKIEIHNITTAPVTIRGDIMKDTLPYTGKVFDWSKDNVLSVRYEPGEGSSCKTTAPEYWRVEEDAQAEGTFHILWSEDFSMTLAGGGTVDLYITLQFPKDEEGDLRWNEYLKERKGSVVYNTFYLDGLPSDVMHHLNGEAEVVLRKGVYETAWANNYNTSTTRANGRQTYGNGSNVGKELNTDGINCLVHYYTVVYNSGSVNLYLDGLYDVLPRGFHFRGMSYPASTGNMDRSWYNKPITSWTTNDCATESPSGVAANSFDLFHNSFATVNPGAGKEVYHVDATVRASTATTGNGGETITFTFAPRSTKVVGAHTLKYDESVGKYYLAPGELIRFGYVCKVDSYDYTDDFATNTISMPFYDYYREGVRVGDVSDIRPIDETTMGSNDGDCIITTSEQNPDAGYAHADETEQWLTSSVTLRRGEVTPGLQKTVGGISAKVKGDDPKTIQGSRSGDFGDKYTGAVKAGEVINWRVRVYNESNRASDGGNILSRYTLTDTVEPPYAFCGEVFATLYNSSGTAHNSTALFALGNRTIDDQQVEIMIWHKATNGKFKYEWSTQKLQVNGPAITGANEKGDLYTVQLLRDEETKRETLIVNLLGDTYGIPDGFHMDFGIHTLYNTNNIDLATSYVNDALLNTRQIYDPRLVFTGRNVTDLETGEPGIESSASVAMIYGFATSAYKETTLLQNGVKTSTSARSDSDRNYIALTQENAEFRYSLYVHMPDESYAVLKRLLILDNLPEVDDHTPYTASVPRESRFKVSLLDDPAFTVMIRKSDSEEYVPVNADEYTLQISTKTEFGGSTSEDWNSKIVTPEGWVDINNATTEQIRAARSLRVAFRDNDDGEALLPPKSQIRVEFNAKVDDPNVLPGDRAWNSFGYNYTVLDNSMERTLRSEPEKVGVMFPEAPQIAKRLVSDKGLEYKANQDLTFAFLIYTGSKVTALNKAEDMKPAEIAALLQDRDLLYVPLTVKKGESTARTEPLYHLHKWKIQGDTWVEADENFDWVNGTYYNIIELPPEKEWFQLRSLGTANSNNYRFAQNSAKSVTLTAVNQTEPPPLGELTITKTLTRWHDAGPATFVFQVEGVDDIGNTVYS
ncbi:MAG: leucine-rich repeat protein, partial [Oscillospiraceae bacterium]|nr:leucine-rich repeat protein [Oscillospiraceae bacterium]